MRFTLNAPVQDRRFGLINRAERGYSAPDPDHGQPSIKPREAHCQSSRPQPNHPGRDREATRSAIDHETRRRKRRGAGSRAEQ